MLPINLYNIDRYRFFLCRYRYRVSVYRLIPGIGLTLRYAFYCGSSYSGEKIFQLNFEVIFLTTWKKNNILFNIFICVQNNNVAPGKSALSHFCFNLDPYWRKTLGYPLSTYFPFLQLHPNQHYISLCLAFHMLNS